MFGLLAASGNLGGIVMPWVVGAIADLTPTRSLRWGLASAIACPVLMMLCLGWMDGHRSASGRSAVGAVLAEPA
jgi:hypothetical protein